MEKLGLETKKIMNNRFGKDSLIAVATIKDGKPFVRTVDGYYENGCFYVITYALSNKMQHISENPAVAVSGDWFTAEGEGENIGYIRAPENVEIAEKLRKAFAAWYDNGHTNEDDPNTCILCIHLKHGVLFSEGTRYEIDFT